MFLFDERTLSSFPFLIGGMLRGGQSFVCGMSSTNSNSEDYFSDRPKRLHSFDGLFRSEAQLTFEEFFVLSSGNPVTIIAPKTITKRPYFVPETANHALDDFEVKSLPCCHVACVIRLRWTS
jgi:hypothetical protein